MCGQPACSGMLAGEVFESRCKLHPFTTEEVREAFRGFLVKTDSKSWSRAKNGERVFQ